MTDFTALRERMVERQIEARGIDDPALLAAFRAVPREAFVSARLVAMPLMTIRRCRSRPGRRFRSPISSR